MALRKLQDADEMAPPSNGRSATALAEPPVGRSGPVGRRVHAIGQPLVEAGQLDAERPRHGAAARERRPAPVRRHRARPLRRGRNELAAGGRRGVRASPSSTPSIDRSTPRSSPCFPEDVARKHKVVPIARRGRHGRHARRRPVAGSAGSGRAASRTPSSCGRRPTSTTVRTFIEQLPRRRRHRPPRRRSLTTDDQRVAAEATPRSTSTTRRRSSSSSTASSARRCATAASDIHVEPLDDTLRIRFRIDGHLVEAFSLPRRRARRARRAASRS